ncbi:hypothetical protein NCER_102085 [Vairimorpha ceranae BRL01]|uniref:Uncharacterized protein n=1 Tax=Vairimorpha ceranae (strain BRL01) TaxID=578460 RepID=C4VBD4_VAIC1|nr:hypothetical protein NCER_102085 [Vairimorpha ceranae BRL01]
MDWKSLASITIVVSSAILIVIIATILICKHYFKSRKKQIDLNSNFFGSMNIKPHIDTMKLFNPDLDNDTLRKLYLSFRAIVMGYAKYSESVVICEARLGAKDQIVNFKISESNPTDAENKILKNYERIKMSGSPDWKKAILKLSFIKVDEQILFDLNEDDKFLIQNNEKIIADLLEQSNISLSLELKKQLLEKSIKTTNEEMRQISPLDIMFSKYVKFFLLKEEN